MTAIETGRLNRRVRIERPVPDNAFDGAGSGAWEHVATPWAEVKEVRPSRAEKLADGINIATRPARVVMRYRADVTPDMRLLLGQFGKDEAGNRQWQTDRITQIIGGPTELGEREGIELMVEDYTSAGNAA